MARDVHPEIRRALGAAEAYHSNATEHGRKADRLLDEAAGKPREKQPSLADIKEDIVEETSAVIRAELAKRDADEDTLSMHLPGGSKVRAQGVKAIGAAVLIALFLAVAAGLFFVGRVTAPRVPVTEAPK